MFATVAEQVDHMDGQGKQSDGLMVARGESCVVIQVMGRGTFKTSPALRKFTLKMLDQGRERFVLDMQECTGLDSTFMGVLAGTALRLKQRKGGEIIMINLSPRTADLLETLGLRKLIGTAEGARGDSLRKEIEKLSGPARLDTGGSDRKTTAETMLAAHEDLVEASPANLGEFQDVLVFLRKELEQSSGLES